MNNLMVRNPVVEWSELRAMPEDGQPRRLAGYAAKFETFTPYYNEIIARGAFQKSLIEGDQLALVNHDRSLVLGRVGAGTLQLAEDMTGLAFQVTLGNQTYAADLWESVARGDVVGCSFGFSPVRVTTRKMPSGIMANVVVEAALFEISITGFPAYPQTEVIARAVEEMGTEETTKVIGNESTQRTATPLARLMRAHERERVLMNLR